MNISVIVHPNNKRPRIEKDLFGDLHIYVKEPPLEGQANDSVRKALAKHFSVSPSRVSLLRGQRSKLKVFQID
jgi:uncharacterized protein YggU (UPF0235/DUF167 family)